MILSEDILWIKSIELDNVEELVPKDLIKFAIKKEFVMTSAVNIIEIWDKELYEKSINDSEIDFAQLTEDVMLIQAIMYITVLLNESVESWNKKWWYLCRFDLGGGHSKEILKKLIIRKVEA